jgi:hypothetical protein
MGLIGAFKRRDVEPFAMIGLRGLVERAPREERREHRRLFGLVDGSRDLREAYTVFAAAKFDAAVARGEVAVDAAEPAEGRFQKFLTWILEHKEEILAFIKMIVGLFGGVPVAAPVAVGPVDFAAPEPQHVTEGPVRVNLTIPPVDIAAVTDIAAKVEAARKALSELASTLGDAVKTIPGLGSVASVFG